MGYGLPISDWSSDVCSSELLAIALPEARWRVWISARVICPCASGLRSVRPGRSPFSTGRAWEMPCPPATARNAWTGCGWRWPAMCPTAFSRVSHWREMRRTASIAWQDRKRGVEGKRVAERVGVGGRWIIKKKNITNKNVTLYYQHIMSQRQHIKNNQ